ncbi:hypothetical protein BASA62_009508 [Batrachochytrium salamandrivorans]|nr:hypothetical protein BASA62_009508 [Batrachochytrium salamandrivorans]
MKFSTLIVLVFASVNTVMAVPVGRVDRTYSRGVSITKGGAKGCDDTYNTKKSGGHDNTYNASGSSNTSDSNNSSRFWITVIRAHSRCREVSDRDVHCLDYCSICSSTTFLMVSHPSQSLDYRETTDPIRGLMYADDVAVFADSEQSLLAASTAVENWADWWEMQFGVAKCGIISFTGHLAPRLDNPIGYSTPWTVGQSCGVIQVPWCAD